MGWVGLGWVCGMEIEMDGKWCVCVCREREGATHRLPFLRRRLIPWSTCVCIGCGCTGAASVNASLTLHAAVSPNKPDTQEPHAPSGPRRRS